jgi:predicted regulator of Ras-like GTPase activity (Roadblock/LC7/MglB family)
MTLPKGLDFSTQHLDEIHDCLTNLRWETEARCVLLADITGQLIEEQGISTEMNTAALSALAAGEMAATKEMARLVGQRARFKLLLHEGDDQSVYLSDVGEEMLLVSVFDNSTPIGMVRLFTREAVEQLKAIASRSRAEDQKPTPDLMADFGQLLSDELDLSLSEWDR